MNSPAATTLENNKKFRLQGATENRLHREVGGGHGIRTPGEEVQNHAQVSKRDWRWYPAPATKYRNNINALRSRERGAFCVPDPRSTIGQQNRVNCDEVLRFDEAERRFEPAARR